MNKMKGEKTNRLNRFFLLGMVVGGAGLLGWGGVTPAVGAAPLAEISGKDRPNIVFILADDMGYGDLSILGQKNFQTPTLDRMAREGLLFTDHYAGSTVCAPSRAALLTGNHTGRVWQRANFIPGPPRGDIQFRRDPHDITVARRLREAGYHTAMIGKSGVACNSDDATLPNDKGFDHFFGFLAHVDAHRFYPPVLIRNGETVQYPPNRGHEGEIYSGDLFLDETLRYLDERAASEPPFFLHVALQQPHADLSAPEEFRAPFMNRFDENPRPVGGYRPTTHPAATYAAMVVSVDHTVRRILQKLRQLGIEENTLVIFSSDNGSYSEGGYHYRMHDSNAPFRGGKRDLYEGGIRVPMIAWWPGTIAPGGRTDHVSAFWDFAPTVLELAGVPVPEGMDGISYLPTLRGRSEDQRPHEYLYWEFYEMGGRQALRTGDWKGVRLGVRNNPTASLELYHLGDDPAEERDVAAQHPRIVERIEALMREAHQPHPHFTLYE
jgi:arylsulfatase A